MTWRSGRFRMTSNTVRPLAHARQHTAYCMCTAVTPASTSSRHVPVQHEELLERDVLRARFLPQELEEGLGNALFEDFLRLLVYLQRKASAAVELPG